MDKLRVIQWTTGKVEVGGNTVGQIRVARYLTKNLAESWGNHEWDTMTAMPAVNALGTVKAARPGILGLADVGLAAAPAGLWSRA